MLVNINHNLLKLAFVLKSNLNQVLLLTYFLNHQSLKVDLSFLVHQKSSLQIIILTSLRGNSRLELTTLQSHQQSESSSNLLCKTLVNQNSQFIYNGKIIIHHQANQADAYQRNENLMIDEDSSVMSRPGLEIKANDVFCTHGSFSSSLDQLEIYYLQTRGLSAKEAENLLAKGFLLSGLDSLIGQSFFSADKIRKLQTQISQRLQFN